MEILNNTYSYKGAPIEDVNLSADFTQTGKPLDDYDIIELLKISNQFLKEQQQSRKFRLHGSINLVSPLNNRPKAWGELAIVDKVLPKLTSNYSMDSSFDLFVGYISQYVHVFGLDSGYYQEKITLITDNNSVDVLNCGFSQNIFQEKTFNFVVQNEVDINGLFSNGLHTRPHIKDEPISRPVSDLIIYCRPKDSFSLLDFSNVRNFNGHDFSEGTTFGFKAEFSTSNDFVRKVRTLLKPAGFEKLLDAPFYKFIISSIIFLFKANNIEVTYENILINKDLILYQAGLARSGLLTPNAVATGPNQVMGNIVYFDSDNLVFRDVIPQLYEIKQSVHEVVTQSTQEKWRRLGFKYSIMDGFLHLDFNFLINPFHKIPVLAFSEFIETEDIKTLPVIPPFSVLDKETSVVRWRDVLDPGYIEQTSNNGFDFPFINDCHYVFSRINIFMKPNLSNYNTYRLFKSAIGIAEITGSSLVG